MVRRSVTAFSRTSLSQLAVWSAKKSSFEIGCHIRSAMHRSPPSPSEPGTHRSHLAMGVARLPLAARFLTAPQLSEHGRGRRAPSRQVIERSLSGAPQHHSRRLCCLPGARQIDGTVRRSVAPECPRQRGPARTRTPSRLRDQARTRPLCCAPRAWSSGTLTRFRSEIPHQA